MVYQREGGVRVSDMNNIHPHADRYSLHNWILIRTRYHYHYHPHCPHSYLHHQHHHHYLTQTPTLRLTLTLTLTLTVILTLTLTHGLRNDSPRRLHSLNGELPSLIPWWG